MNSPKKISDIKAYQKPHDSIFTSLITRHFSRSVTFLLLKYDKNVTPNQVSIFSLLLAVLACLLFINDNYAFRVLGVVLMQISFIFDCCDGEIARYKNMGSKFGAWLDSAADRLKEILMFMSLTFLAYIQYPKKIIIIIGFVTMINWLLVAYLREAKKSSWPVERKAELYITKNIYLGTVDTTIFLVCLAVLVKMEIYALGIILIASIPLIIKQILSAYKLSKQN
jgi:phosphatidylglycerophosphate synthase